MMRKLDQFTEMEIDPRARWRFRKAAQGQCIYCGRAALGRVSCPKCRRKARKAGRLYRKRHAVALAALAAKKMAFYWKLRSEGHSSYSARYWAWKIGRNGIPKDLSPDKLIAPRVERMPVSPRYARMRDGLKECPYR